MIFETLNFIFLTLTAGPPLAISYGLSANIGTELMFLIMIFSYILPIPLLFELTGRIEYSVKRQKSLRFRKFMKVERVVDKFDDIMLEFEKRQGELGYYLALAVITFFFGIYVASIMAYFLKLNPLRAFFSISISAICGVLFWLYVMVTSHTISPMVSAGLGLLMVGVMIFVGRFIESRTISTIKK